MRKKVRAQLVMPHSRVSNLSASRIALGYTVIAILWIAFSNAVVVYLELPPAVQTFKGTVFVLVTATLLYFTIRRLVHGLRAGERRYAVTLASIGDAVIATDPQGSVTFLNAAAEALTGWPLAEAVGQPLAEVFHIINEQSRQPFYNPAAKVLHLGKVVGLANHTALLARDGRETPIDDSGAPIIGDDGAIVGVVLVFRDVTQRRQAEEAGAFRRVNERMELTLRGSNVLLWDVEIPDGDFSHAQAYHVNCGEQFGYDPHPPAGIDPIEAMIHPDDRASAKEAARAYLAGETAEYEREVHLSHKDGSIHTVLVRGVAVRDATGKPIRFAGTGVDITDLKRAEEDLRRAKEEWERTFDSVPDLIAILDEHHQVIRANRAMARRLGTTPQKCIGLPCYRVVHGTDAPPSFCPHAQTLRDVRLHTEEVHEDRLGGDFLVTTTPLIDEQGKLRGAVHVARDVTEQKRAEEALRQSRQDLDRAQEVGQIGWWRLDTRRNVLTWSDETYRIFGVPKETPLTYELFLNVVHPDDRRFVDERCQAGMRGEPYDIEHRVVAEGQVKWVREKAYLEFEGAGALLGGFGIAQDITERKLAEELISERARLASLAADVGIALTGADTLPGILQPCAEALVRHLSAAFARIWTLNEAENVLEMQASAGMYTRTDGTFSRVPVDDRSKLGLIAQQRRPYLTNDVLDDPLTTDREWARREGMVASAGHPILVQDRVVGVMVLFARQPLAEATHKALASVADEIPLGIEHVRQKESLRESEERFRGTFDNAAVGIAHADSSGRFLRVNEKYCEIVGYGREELIQKSIQDVTHPEDVAATMQPLSAVLRGESQGFGLEKRYVRKDGSVIWAALSVSLQRDAAKHVSYTISIIQDISERKRLEGELRRAKEAAEAANRAKDEFLANVSHEIRTPMNAILGMTDLTLDTELTDDQRQCLKTVKSAADSLLSVINDLLDFAKIESGKLELDLADFSLRAALGDTLRTLAVRAHRKGLELIDEVPPNVPDALVGDSVRLRQVLLNLVSNAIKFTDEGEVVVRVELEHDPAAVSGIEKVGLRFTVRDTGIGIPQEQQTRIFRAFEQEDTSTTRKYGGTGLGLTIASQLVALMGGTITVDSEPGRGSTFAFTARFGRQQHPSEPVPHQPLVSLRGLPVLVVDDNATNRHILDGWLRGWQMEPAAVGNGLAALDAVWDAVHAGQPYPLVLLDARMPDADGLTVAGKIRERPELSAMRIILLTSEDRPGDLARSREQQIDAHLLKPVQQDELLETICRVMSRTGGDSMPAARTGEGEQASAPAAAASPLRVLAAEDNEFNAQLLEQLLGRRGHQVRVASNGREALGLAETQAYDLLLLDVHMPELDGFEVVKAVRERERTSGSHLPIIALTARSRKEDRERCLAAGMDEFLAKPIRAADLWAAIERIMGACPPAEPTGLLDPRVILAACGGDAAILEKICQAFRACLPGHLKAVQDALRDRDAPRLREVAHKLCGMVAAFSTVAGGLASQLEDCAAQGQIEEAQPLVEQIDSMSRELMRLADGLSLETLRHQSV